MVPSSTYTINPTSTPSSVLQLALVEVIPELHSLEQVASEEHIGTMAENLMEAMRDNPTCEETVRHLWVGQMGWPKSHVNHFCIAVLMFCKLYPSSHSHEASFEDCNPVHDQHLSMELRFIMYYSCTYGLVGHKMKNPNMVSRDISSCYYSSSLSVLADQAGSPGNT